MDDGQSNGQMSKIVSRSGQLFVGTIYPTTSTTASPPPPLYLLWLQIQIQIQIHEKKEWRVRRRDLWKWSRKPVREPPPFQKYWRQMLSFGCYWWRTSGLNLMAMGGWRWSSTGAGPSLQSLELMTSDATAHPMPPPKVTPKFPRIWIGRRGTVSLLPLPPRVVGVSVTLSCRGGREWRDIRPMLWKGRWRGA